MTISPSISVVENSPTFSGNIRSRLKDRTLLFRYLAEINLIFGAWYLHWRITHSINFAALWLSIPLLIAEIYSYFGGVMFLLGLWRPIVRRVKSLNQMTPPLPRSEWPSVDVFITCYNEPVEIVQETTRAALAMDYPTTKLCVYVLDDGNSPELRAMTERLGLDDLQSPLLQQEAERINKERSQLVTRLRQLENLTPEVPKAEELLQSFQLQVHTQPKDLSEVLSWFETLRQPSIPPKVWIECQTVLAEGFDNAVRHAHKGLSPETPIDIEATIFTQSIELRIWDYGRDFDFEGHLQQLPDEVDEMAEGGRGVGIMQRIADYLSYTRTPDNRNCLLIIKSYSKVTDSNTTGRLEAVIGGLQSFRQLILLLNPKHHAVSDYLASERRNLEKAIYQKELELSELARCCYIARPKPKGKPHHAKAGNINYAIFSGETAGDFILTLDADHIPKSHFLQRALPYFYTYNFQTGKYDSNQIAFVQTPQAFYNIPTGDPFGHQAHLFYGPIQQGKDGMNSAFYTGTNAVLRREALINVGLQNFSDEFSKDEKRLDEFDLVGGVSSNSITEDMNTAMRLHSAGWKSVYHHEELSEGLAPDDLSSTLKQKLRWAQGTIQVLLRENPLTKTGLTFWQQLQYFQTMYSYFSGFATLVFIACPIIYFFTGIIPVHAYGADFALHFIPTFILNRLTFMAASWGVPAGELWRSEQYAIALFPLFIQAVWSVFTGRPIKFQVTPKQRQSGIYLRLVWPQLTIVALTLLGMLWCVYRFATGNLENPSLYLLNAAWAVYNLSLFWVIIRAAVWQPKS
ncbi:MAG: ATP-binding protein [Symplocastrum torsivum CPER-KK1]|jgi:cellulose synthase (UDP-forming)|uniref:ATP-binding protein n=1 Tax=Symplocastrum torsivum CPER-KK1 TaxID=450513 RepID=A0A951PN66_9CYAN|nr:ATP-binding protein [Symplocastrum torsivum CPER-KK1]